MNLLLFHSFIIGRFNQIVVLLNIILSTSVCGNLDRQQILSSSWIEFKTNKIKRNEIKFK